MVFTCLKCEQSFTINETNLVNKTEISCPNCDAKVSPELLASLKSVCERIAPLEQDELGGIIHNEEWKLQIELDLH